MYKFTRMTYSHPLDDGQLSPPRRLPLLCDCFLSDGGFDVNKYLQRQTALHQRLLWRTSTALNLTNVVVESLSICNQAWGAAATGIKKKWAPTRCVYGCKESANSELQVIKPNECQWWKMYVENHLMSWSILYYVDGSTSAHYQFPHTHRINILEDEK